MPATYHITVSALTDAGSKLCLSAIISEGSPMRVTDAKIDTHHGDLTTDGRNSFRCLCLAETMIRQALGLPLESDEVLILKEQITRLQRQISELASAEPETITA